MSLLKLLAVGKSLIGIKRPAKAFLMRDDQLIPKFADNPRPWAASAMPSKPVTEIKSAPDGEMPDTTRLPATDFFPKAEFKPAKAALAELQPMRNDLSDADLEVVRIAKSKASSKAGTVGGKAAQVEAPASGAVGPQPGKIEERMLNAG